MKKYYQTPLAETIKVNIEQGFMVDSISGEDSGIPDLLDPGLGDVVWAI